VWCEAQPIYKTGTYTKLDNVGEWQKDELMTQMWKRLGKRYGHKYVYIGGHRDNYPQVVTSRFPLEAVDRIIGNADTLVSHGAGWVRLKVAGKPINIVTLHTWPQQYGFNVPQADRERSKAAFEGDKFRRAEMEYICKQTVLSHPKARKELWVMMGDFNSVSRVDNSVYGYPDNDTRFLVHDYIRVATPYVDIIKTVWPDSVVSTTGGRSRIDFMYVTPSLKKRVKKAAVVRDDYTRPVRNPQKISNFWHPSDHLPILMEMDMKKPKN
jgi:endonuclease/exonuclease/phosphatase family metal-dependent hydrolase